MKRTICDRCNSDVLDNTKGQVWDQTFAYGLHGAIFKVTCEGNYMNSQVDLCYDCKLYGIAQLMKQNPGFHRHLDKDQLNSLEACINDRKQK